MLSDVLLTLAGHDSSLFTVVDHVTPDESTGSMKRPWSWTLRLSPAVQGVHPGERATLDYLASIAAKYRRVTRFCNAANERARKQFLLDSTHLNNSQSFASASSEDYVLIALVTSSILQYLESYQQSVIGVETDILRRNWDIVSIKDNLASQNPCIPPFVSLTNIRSRFSDWEIPLTALNELVTTLLEGPSKESPSELASNYGQQPPECPRWSSGQMMDLLAKLSDTGVGPVHKCMSSLLHKVEAAWRQSLISWMCEGESSADSSSATLNIGSIVEWQSDARTDHDIESFLDPEAPALNNQRSSEHWKYESDDHGLADWSIKRSALPAWMIADQEVSSAILYVGRALCKVRSSNISRKAGVAPLHQNSSSGIPQSLVTGNRNLLETVWPNSMPLEFKRAVQHIRNDVAEWMWRNVLTPDVVFDAFDTLSGFFLHRKGLFVSSFLDQLFALRRSKRLASRSAATGTISHTDLELALQRATVGSEAENTSQLDNCSIVMPQNYHARWTEGDWKPKEDTSMSLPVRFDDIALTGVPFSLKYQTPFPVDLILMPSEIRVYSELFSYLLAIHSVRSQLCESWMSLSKAQRARRRFTGVNEGGTDTAEEVARRNLLRMAYGIAREGLWFLEVLSGHFQTDVIDVQYTKLIHQLHRLRVDPETVPDVEMVSSNTSLRTEDASQLRNRMSGANSNVRRVSSIRQLSEQSEMLELDDHVYRTPSMGDSMLRRAMGARGGRASQSNYGGQHLLGSLRTNTTPMSSTSTQETYSNLDFATSRAIHQAFLSYVAEGLLLTDGAASSCIWQVLHTCMHFVHIIEQWGGDVLPELLTEGSVSEHTSDAFQTLQVRAQTVHQISDALVRHLNTFFSLISNASSSSSTAPINRITATDTQNTDSSVKAARYEAESAAARHHEQLLLRLDFNGILSRRAM